MVSAHWKLDIAHQQTMSVMDVNCLCIHCISIQGSLVYMQLVIVVIIHELHCVYVSRNIYAV